MQAEPRAYVFAPLVAPTVHVAASAGWQVIAGRSDLAVTTAGWQAIAWFALVSFVLATHPITLRVLRSPLLKLAHSVPALLSWAVSVVSALAASYILFVLGLPVASWFAAFAASAFAFSAICASSRGAAGENRPNHSFKRTPDGAA